MTDANTARRDLAAAQLRSGGRGIGGGGNLTPRAAAEIEAEIEASSSCFVTFELLSSPTPSQRGAAPPSASTSAVTLLGGVGDPSWRETLSLPLASPSPSHLPSHPPSAPRRLRISLRLSETGTSHIGGDGSGLLLGSTEVDLALQP